MNIERHARRMPNIRFFSLFFFFYFYRAPIHLSVYPLNISRVHLSNTHGMIVKKNVYPRQFSRDHISAVVSVLTAAEFLSHYPLNLLTKYFRYESQFLRLKSKTTRIM